MGTFALPPGFRFHPTDEELISCYLKGKLSHGLKAAELEVITEVDLYKCEPWDLPEKSFLPSTDMEWYFFSPRDRKYPNGSRTNRATEAGYWKATGRDRKIYSRASTIGIKKTLVFYRGRAPQGERSDWVMHEYRLEENECEAVPCLQNAFVLCRVFNKSGLGAKSGEQYIAQVEKGDLSLTEKNSLPGYFGDIEVHSEDQSNPVEGTDAISKLPSKISSKILNDTTGDSAALNTWLDVLLDDTNLNSSCVAPDEDTVNTQVDSMPNTPRMQRESACLPFDEIESPQMPVNISFNRYGVPNGCLDAYFEEERMLEEMLSAGSQDYNNSKAYHSFLGDTFADILNGGYIEVKNLIPSMEELENHYCCLWEVPNRSLDHEGTGIQVLGDTFADILNGGYIEVKNLIPSMEELENHDCCLWEVPNRSLDHEGTGIQVPSCSPMLQSHNQRFLFEGTAARRVRMQVHKMEDSAERTEKDLTVRHSENTSDDWYDSNSGSSCGPEMQQLHFDRFDGQKCDSKNARENKGSAPKALPTHMAGRIDGLSFQKHDQIVDAANSAFVSISVEDVKSIAVSHNLTSMLVYSSSYGLFINKETSEIIEVPINIFQTSLKDKTNCVNDFPSLSQDLTPSSSPGNSNLAMFMRNRMSNPKMNNQAPSEQYVLDSSKPSITEHVQESENSASKNDIGILTQAACLGKDSLLVKVLENSGTSSLELGPQMNGLELTSSETMVVAFHNEDDKPSKNLSKFLSCIPASSASAVEYDANLNAAKGILDLDVATNSGLAGVAINNGHVTAMSLISTCSNEGVGFPASNTVSSSLRFRMKLEPQNIRFVDEEKNGVVMDESYGCCAKQHPNGMDLSFVQPREFFSLFSALRRRWSWTGSLAVFLVACLLGTAFLIFFFLLSSGFSRFTRTFLLLYFSKASSHYKICSVSIDDPLTVILDAG